MSIHLFNSSTGTANRDTLLTGGLGGTITMVTVEGAAMATGQLDRDMQSQA